MVHVISHFWVLWVPYVLYGWFLFLICFLFSNYFSPDFSLLQLVMIDLQTFVAVFFLSSDSSHKTSKLQLPTYFSNF